MYMRNVFLRKLLLALTMVPALAWAQVGPPDFATGDTWTYREINGFNNIERAMVVRQVASVSGGMTQIQQLTQDGRIIDQTVLAGGVMRDGVLSDRAAGVLDPGLDLRPFPLKEGQTWSQKVSRNDRVWHDRRPVRVDGKVLGWETVRVPAGEFKALKLERQMYLGDGDPFRQETLRTETEWYVPELKAAAKLHVREFYRSGASPLGRLQSGDWYTQELTSFKRSN